MSGTLTFGTNLNNLQNNIQGATSQFVDNLPTVTKNSDGTVSVTFGKNIINAKEKIDQVIQYAKENKFSYSTTTNPDGSTSITIKTPKLDDLNRFLETIKANGPTWTPDAIS